jgi:hypothetical protein
MILVDVDIISVSIQGMVEYQRCIHKRARVHHGATFFDHHAFKVKDEDSIKDLERKCALSSKYHDLLICHLKSIRHVSWNPLSLITTTSWNFLPRVLFNIIDFNGVYNPLLIDSSSKREKVLILEATQ